MDMNIYHLLKILKRKIKKKIQIGKNGNRKTKFIFWNFKDQKKWKNTRKRINKIKNLAFKNQIFF